MAASDARGRGDSALEQYVCQLLRDADRARRSTQPRIRPDTATQVDRRAQTPLRSSPSSATDTRPPTAGYAPSAREVQIINDAFGSSPATKRAFGRRRRSS